MIRGTRYLLQLILGILLVPLLAAPQLVLAQPADRPCAADVAPADDFESAGIGLIREELVALYGEGEAGQGSIFYNFHGYDLHRLGCDLILAFPLTGIEGGQEMDEFALVEALLPADAEYVGSFARGTTIFPLAVADLWHSASLAERFSEMGENRGGDILIVYSYGYEGMEQGPIQQIELRTLALPE